MVMENKIMRFEVDTRSDSTIVSFEMFKKLVKANIKLKLGTNTICFASKC